MPETSLGTDGDAEPGFTPDATAIPPSTGNSAPNALPPAIETGGDEPTPILWWIAGFGALAALIFGLFAWRRRSSGAMRALPPPQLSPHPTGEPATTAAAPAKVDISLDIVTASRSMRMFMLEYRVNIANRSDRAVRNISIAAHLSSAERGSANAAPVGAGQPVDTVDRIGPHQSRTVTGEMHLPLTEVRAILQGQKPLFIPLLHLTVEGAGLEAMTRTYVVGLPSGAAQGRLHPIPLDTPPGGVPGLRAREIKLAA